MGETASRLQIELLVQNKGLECNNTPTVLKIIWS